MMSNWSWRRKAGISVSAILTVIVITTFLLMNVLGFGNTKASATQTPTVEATSVSLPNYYLENMVFQRNKPIAVRGTTNKNATLTITIGDDSKRSSKTVTANKKGVFTAELDALPARIKPYTFTISSGNRTLAKIEKTYVGDVFVASGQSNMEVSYDGYYGSEGLRRANMHDTFTEGDLPDPIYDANVHFLVADRVSGETAEDSDLPLTDYEHGAWLAATGSNSRRLSYLAQFFAEELRDHDDSVPIGIIQTAWGGSAIKKHMQGGDIFNTHIAPLRGFNIGAVLWYQGEAEAGNPSDVASYSTNFVTLINQYRSVFNDADLPFLYVQLTRYAADVDTQGIRQAQLDALRAAGTPRNVAMTVSIDTDKGTSEVIHPLGKDILAYRMAKQWEAIQSKKTIPESPLAERATYIAGDKTAAIVIFRETTGDGLQAMSPRYSVEATPTHVADKTDAELQGFEVAGPDGKFKPASASIIGDNSIVVSADGVDEVRQVRYLWASNPTDDVLLYNHWNLPASPFRISVSDNS